MTNKRKIQRVKYLQAKHVNRKIDNPKQWKEDSIFFDPITGMYFRSNLKQLQATLYNLVNKLATFELVTAQE